MTIEEQIKQRRSKAIKEKDHDLQKLEFHEIAEMEAGLDEIPFLPQVFLTDATPESLAKSVCEQKGRSAVISDEGGVMDVMGGIGPSRVVYCHSSPTSRHNHLYREDRAELDLQFQM